APSRTDRQILDVAAGEDQDEEDHQSESAEEVPDQMVVMIIVVGGIGERETRLVAGRGRGGARRRALGEAGRRREGEGRGGEDGGQGPSAHAGFPSGSRGVRLTAAAHPSLSG